jgi:hypothetical protein
MTEDEFVKQFPAFPSGQYKLGMTLRDYFAAKAMQATLSDDPDYHQKYQFIDLAHFSYQCADAMLKARDA